MSTKDEQIVKVEGWAAPEGFSEQGIAVVYDEQLEPRDRPCTLLIAPEGSTQVPRVLTLEEHEAKMTAMARDLFAASDDGPYVPNYDAMRKCVAKHGITLAP